MNILVVDDNPHRVTFFQNGLKQHKVTVCNHVRAAIKALKKTSFDVIFLDHDLEKGRIDPESEDSGSEVARFIADYGIACSCIILHTDNEAGREMMQAILDECHVMPYGKLKKLGFHAVLKLVHKTDDASNKEE